MAKMDKMDNLCRSFRQDFPEFVSRAEGLGVSIKLSKERRKGRDRVFWLDGYRQLTGYTTRRDGTPFTEDDARKNIDKILSEIEEDRRLTADMPIPARFERVMSEFRKIEPQYRMIGEVRLPNGDNGHCFFMSDYGGDVQLHGVGVVAKARVDWSRDERDREHLERFCRALEESFAARSANAE